MLKAEDMIKVRIYSPKNRLKSVIEVMYNAKAVDVIQHQKNLGRVAARESGIEAAQAETLVMVDCRVNIYQ